MVNTKISLALKKNKEFKIIFNIQNNIINDEYEDETEDVNVTLTLKRIATSRSLNNIGTPVTFVWYGNNF